MAQTVYTTSTSVLSELKAFIFFAVALTEPVESMNGSHYLNKVFVKSTRHAHISAVCAFQMETIESILIVIVLNLKKPLEMAGN